MSPSCAQSAAMREGAGTMDPSVTDLSRIAVFSALRDETLAVLQRVVVKRTFFPNQIVFTAGEQSGGLWFLKEGQVRIFAMSPDGRKQDFCVMRAGMCCGCPLFFGDVNPAWAEAVDTVTFYFIERSVALQLAEAHADIGLVLCRVFGKGERLLASLIVGLSGSPVVGRVAQSILDHVNAADLAAGGESPRVLALSHQELADLVGSSREVVTRCLDTLERARIIALGRKRITVLDTRRLTNITETRCTLALEATPSSLRESPSSL